MTNVKLGGGVVPPGPGGDELGVDFFVVDFGSPVDEGGLGCFEELVVVAVGEVGLVVGASAFVAEGGPLDDHAAEVEHVLELAGEGEAGVGPLALVAQVDVRKRPCSSTILASASARPLL